MRNELKTKRLLISPLTDEELEELIISTEDEGLKIAYSEMLEGAMEDVKNRNWYAP